ncbi:hypothetical protein [Streptomyces griseorubiginosus]|uniref:hypothetical protein n=1 Tax=Streptomyces griseorubiginosus TaxID=67304 RepID=UPI0036ED6A23
MTSARRTPRDGDAPVGTSSGTSGEATLGTPGEVPFRAPGEIPLGAPGAIPRHRRVRTARKPLIGGLVATAALVGAWYATAGAATAPALAPTTTAVTLSAKFPYLSAGYNNTREWTRTATAVAPNGTLRVAWPASDGVHVTPLTSAGKRSGADTVVKGAKEVGGLVAHNDGFALLTRVADTNKWKETAAAIVRYTGARRTWTTKLTGAASHDTSPTLDGQLTWNGTKYGAYFVVHGAGGFADGHFGDKLTYVSAKGGKLGGGWGWGCSHDEGIALHAETTGNFTSLCFDDWRSGLFVSTGIGAPDVAPVVQREQCWAGYCGGTFPGRTGDLVKSATGRYATAFASRGAASAKKNPDDSSGRGWTVKPSTSTHQVAVAFLKNRNSGPGKAVYLTNAPGTEHINVHVAPYGKDRLLVSWESLKNPKCTSGTCTGTFTGTHLRLIDWNGKVQGADKVVGTRITGDIAVQKDGTLTWAYVPVAPTYTKPLTGASPTSTSLRIARLKP